MTLMCPSYTFFVINKISWLPYNNSNVVFSSYSDALLPCYERNKIFLTFPVLFLYMPCHYFLISHDHKAYPLVSDPTANIITKATLNSVLCSFVVFTIYSFICYVRFIYVFTDHDIRPDTKIPWSLFNKVTYFICNLLICWLINTVSRFYSTFSVNS